MTYFPIIYLSDFWILKEDFVFINESLSELNLTLHFNTFSMHYFVFQKQFAAQREVHASWGIDSGDVDDIKRMFIEADPILLGITMVVSLLHTVFEVLAFKNDISFWKNKDSMEGISVKSLYIQIGMSIIIFLYLFDNETSYLIVLSSGFGILLDGWKLKRATKFRKTDSFPYFALDDKETYIQSETK
mmetsp:Transcript_35459/g.34497  ORF Transcript_35459/g.34497 Transcript_35459/m.34497 type:complete len:188 (+) Transcript_35459:783-1346(+)